jgi:SPP1 family predicted phage head-tail adaptor
MKYNKNEVTGKMRDRIILQNVTRVRSLTGFASESWADIATIWAFAESKLPGSNETIIDGKNTAKNVSDFTIRYISSISEESRIVWGDKLYQVKNLKVSHDRRFISFQGVFYDSYILTGVNVAASVNGISTTSANLKLIMSVIGQANAIASSFADLTVFQQGTVDVAASVNALGTSLANLTKVISISGDLDGSAFVDANASIVQNISASVNADANISADLKLTKTLESSVTGQATVTGATLDVASSLILDLYPNASAAYSLRKLRTAYTGSAIRVRRSSDNTEQDIGFTGNDLNTTALTTFVGSGNGFVTTWYDQSGNNINVTQTSAAAQPQIVNSGVLVTQNSKPSIYFDGVNDVLNGVALSNYLTSSTFTNICVFNPIALTTNSATIEGNDVIWMDGTNGYAGVNFKSTNLLFASLWDGNKREASVSITANTQVLSFAKRAGTNISISKNNGVFSNAVAGNIQNISNNLTIARSSVFSELMAQEIIFYKTDQTSNSNGINTNINTHYAIY